MNKIYQMGITNQLLHWAKVRSLEFVCFAIIKLSPYRFDFNRGLKYAVENVSNRKRFYINIMKACKLLTVILHDQYQQQLTSLSDEFAFSFF